MKRDHRIGRDVVDQSGHDQAKVRASITAQVPGLSWI